MSATKTKALTAALVTVTLVGSGVGILARIAMADPPGQAARSRWEYKALKRVDVEGLAPKPTEPKTGPSVFEGMNAENLSQGLSVLGDEGWELVAIEPYHHDSYRDASTGSQVNLNYLPTYIFRRPK